VISSEDRAFVKALGARIAQWRAEQGITQVEFAKMLGVSQQAVHAYETAERRVPVSKLPIIAKTLAVSLDDLLGTPAQARAKRDALPPKLLQQLERIQSLPKAKQKIITEMLDGLLSGAERR
jgi:transcriptional regulator with XRE-family HTH domain